MADLLVDTDVFVDHIRGVRRLEPGRELVHYSVVTRFELFAGPAGEEETVRELLAPFEELAINRSVAELGGRIRREAGIGAPDALIAATALENGLTLVSRNRRDFGRVRRLRLRDPA